MKISILTIFSDLFKTWLNHSIIKNAIANNRAEIEIIDFRFFSKDKHKKVDDYQYGGGPGMVLMLQPIVDAIRAIKTKNSIVVLTSPRGTVFNQQQAVDFKNKYDHIILIAGHYEGFDERINHYIDTTISIGDYVLTGGEIPCMIIADAIVRLIDGVISSDSLVSESFNNHLLDYPVYTKPIEFEGHKVPEILLSGHHQKIASYRLEQQELITKQNRFDLYIEYIKNKKKV